MKRQIAGLLMILSGGQARLEAADRDPFDTGEPEMAVREVQLAPVFLTPPVALTLIYNVEKPLKVNARAPKSVQVGSRKLKAKPGGAPTKAVIEPGDVQNGAVHVATEFYVCEEDPAAPCWLRKVSFVVPVAKRGQKTETLELQTPEFPPQARR